MKYVHLVKATSSRGLPADDLLQAAKALKSLVSSPALMYPLIVSPSAHVDIPRGGNVANTVRFALDCTRSGT